MGLYLSEFHPFNSSNRSKRFERLEQLERFERNSQAAHPLIDTLSWVFLAA
jgi:hypothetical protein